MKRAVSLILTAALTLCFLTACSDSDRRYKKEEVEAAALALIKESEELNRIYWGSGLSYVESESEKNGYYYPADKSELARLGISSIAELKEKTLAAFSIAYSESIFYTLLSSIGDEDTGILGYTRYFQSETDIMVYSKYTPLLTDKVTYCYDTLKAVKSKGELVFVEIEVKIERDGKEQTRTLSIGLKEESLGWRIDTPTYTTYRESTSE